MISAAMGAPISIYGNGKQVRDVLYVEDLVRAFRLAVDNIGITAGRIYNIGGGPGNALAVWSEFGDLLAELRGSRVPVTFGDWRPGDQPYYVSDIRKIKEELGWEPANSKRVGITKLWNWVNANLELFPQPAAALASKARA